MNDVTSSVGIKILSMDIFIFEIKLSEYDSGVSFKFAFINILSDMHAYILNRIYSLNVYVVLLSQQANIATFSIKTVCY